ncbi:hypothetical protein CHKEEEPN_3150 [Methylorubrum podarium]|nr:hypothetical protein CHKEEEPN_3150 [Methylorubrum podarium]
MVGDEGAGGAHRAALPLPRQRPVGPRGVAGESEAGVAREVVGRLRRAVGGEVGRRGHQQGAVAGDPAGDEGTVPWRPGRDPDRHVEAVRHDIDEAVAEPEVEADLRVLRQEGRQQRRDPDPAEGDGQRDPHEPLGRRREVARLAVGIGQLVEQRLHPPAIERPGLGQRHPPGGARQEPHAEPPLQPAHSPRQDGGVAPEPSRRGGEAAALRHRHEGRERLQPAGLQEFLQVLHESNAVRLDSP